ncbi:cell division protein FtsQ/DivIB [Streptomyces sp. NBC_01803]|uniref:cell division protein FtsQ/DivIB n=1 Tax=Streptomyces sp. NBC_01803 TaxID=2975946 RepID=UPI002DD898B2|nr:FtsQ-type POTRA domain-containing protein [Streptomyces sp. NBC_01803]WSA46658.1 FtsQ-type POTRA domain-containing protein [Streptomyces sp. NBC_01803]
MAGATTAQRGGERRQPDSGPRPSVRRPGRGPRPLPRRPRLLLLVLVLTLVVGGFGTWVLYGSDWLRVERVSVRWTEGPRKLTEERILAAAGVSLGSPMASLDQDAVRDRTLAALPRLASVQVVRGWPHGVSLKVREREAEVLIPDGDGYAEVDADGVRFGEVAEAVAGVPLVELDLEDSASTRRFGEDRVRRAAVTVAAALPESVRRDTRVIRVTSYDSITLELSGDRTVRWGSAEDSAAKAEALGVVMHAADDARHFNVSVPTAPAVAGG